MGIWAWVATQDLSDACPSDQQCGKVPVKMNVSTSRQTWRS